jgi:hypothetical protein
VSLVTPEAEIESWGSDGSGCFSKVVGVILYSLGVSAQAFTQLEQG